MIPAVAGATGVAPPKLSYLWVAAGTSGSMYTTTSTSLAAGTWTSRTSSFGTSTVGAIASDTTSLYVAVGQSGKLATSPDAITWTQQTSSFSTTDITDVAYGGGYFVAVGKSAKVAWSTDGITWTQVTTGITGDVKRVAWGNGTWVIGNGSGALYTASNPTSTWTSQTSTLGNINDVLYFKGGTIWVACTDTGTTGALASSPDAVTWTARTSAITISDAGGGSFVANATTLVNQGYTGVLTSDVQSSTNGTSYTDRTPAVTSGIIWDSASDDAGLMALLQGTTAAQTSTDGTTWTSRTLPASTLICLAHSSGTPSLR